MYSDRPRILMFLVSYQVRVGSVMCGEEMTVKPSESIEEEEYQQDFRLLSLKKMIIFGQRDCDCRGVSS